MDHFFFRPNPYEGFGADTKRFWSPNPYHETEMAERFCSFAFVRISMYQGDVLRRACAYYTLTAQPQRDCCCVCCMYQQQHPQPPIVRAATPPPIITTRQREYGMVPGVEKKRNVASCSYAMRHSDSRGNSLVHINITKKKTREVLL